MRFRIVGNGAYGKALNKIIGTQSIIEESLGNIEPLQNEDYLIPAVPSKALIEVLSNVLNYGLPKCIICVSKGIFSDKFLSQEIENYLKSRNLNIPILFFSGPHLAKDVAKNTQLISATIAGPKEITKNVKKELKIILNETEDIIGAQIGGVLKNIYAFVIGYLSRFEITENARATIIAEGLKEMEMLCEFLGGKKETLKHACGLGDLILTATSQFSRNYKAGTEFGIQENGNETKESLNSVKNIHKMKKDLNLPIVEFANKIIDGQSPSIEDLNEALLEAYSK